MRVAIGIWFDDYFVMSICTTETDPQKLADKLACEASNTTPDQIILVDTVYDHFYIGDNYE